jgi:hypothetical protein
MLQYIVFLHLLNTYFPHMPVTMAKSGADEETMSVPVSLFDLLKSCQSSDSANLECVTEHELATLRHVRDKMPWVWSRFSYLILFLTLGPMPQLAGILCWCDRICGAMDVSWYLGMSCTFGCVGHQLFVRTSTTIIFELLFRLAPATAPFCPKIALLVLRVPSVWDRRRRLLYGL